MQTECTPKLFEFEAVERRSVVAGFDGGNITSNAGALLLGQVDRGVGWCVALPTASSIDATLAMSSIRSRPWGATHLRPGVGL